VERGGVLARRSSGQGADDELFGPGELVALRPSDGWIELGAVGDTVVYALAGSALHELITAGARHQTDDRSDGQRDALSGFDRSLLAAIGMIASTDPLCCTRDTTIRDAAVAMTDRRFGSIVVIDADGKGVGIVTNTDIRRRVVAEGRQLSEPVGARGVSSDVVVACPSPGACA
jgi:CBS domain-containing protein